MVINVIRTPFHFDNGDESIFNDQGLPKISSIKQIFNDCTNMALLIIVPI